jgi:hypothetical protein
VAPGIKIADGPGGGGKVSPGTCEAPACEISVAGVATKVDIEFTNVFKAILTTHAEIYLNWPEEMFGTVPTG